MTAIPSLGKPVYDLVGDRHEGTNQEHGQSSVLLTQDFNNAMLILICTYCGEGILENKTKQRGIR